MAARSRAFRSVRAQACSLGDNAVPPGVRGRAGWVWWRTRAVRGACAPRSWDRCCSRREPHTWCTALALAAKAWSPRSTGCVWQPRLRADRHPDRHCASLARLDKPHGLRTSLGCRSGSSVNASGCSTGHNAVNTADRVQSQVDALQDSLTPMHGAQQVFTTTA